jgi:cob(I)alamin adenosyltransferase
MKIYTKKGDAGETALLGGRHVSKAHQRIDAYGSVDELNSFIGLVRDQVHDNHEKEILLKIQHTLFIIGSSLAQDPEKSFDKLPKITDADVSLLEQEIDKTDEVVPHLKEFILPGGHVAVSQCHVARSVCRRAERCVVELAASEPVPKIIITYVNRLSDYLFMLARKIGYDLGIPEIQWKK